MPNFLTANDRPGEYPDSWYAATAQKGPAAPPLKGDARADVCVVGGGYAGLSAALHLAEAGLDVRLVEANRVGWGASGRNGGQLGACPRADIRKYERTVGPDDARKVWDIAIEANRLVRDLIARHGIDCDLTDGYLEACWKPSHVADTHAYVEHVAKTYGNDAITPLSRDELHAIIATPCYHGGYRDGWAAHLHPLNLALGLARAAEAAGARLHERSRVTRIAPGRVETAQGAVTAEWVILACNGYLDGLDRRVAARAMPINNYIVATEPLGEARARELISEPVCVCDSKFALNYYRFSPDHRLIFGGGETFSAKFPSDIRAFVRKPLLEVFPQLAGARLDYGWGGTLAITASRMPLFQRLDGRMLAISGWSGSGVHMATMGGRIAAEAVRGALDRFDLLASLPTPAFPGGDMFRSALLKLAMTWYGLRDRL